MHDQDGMRAIGAAVAALADDPCPPGGFHRGQYHRLRVGRYRGGAQIELMAPPSTGIIAPVM